MATEKKCDAFVIDTYRDGKSRLHIPGANIYSGRKKMKSLQWADHKFETQNQADDFVRHQLAESSLREAVNEGELRR